MSQMLRQMFVHSFKSPKNSTYKFKMKGRLNNGRNKMPFQLAFSNAPVTSLCDFPCKSIWKTNSLAAIISLEFSNKTVQVVYSLNSFIRQFYQQSQSVSDSRWQSVVVSVFVSNCKICLSKFYIVLFKLQNEIPPQMQENSPQKPLLATRKWFFGHCYVQSVYFFTILKFCGVNGLIFNSKVGLTDHLGHIFCMGVP